MNFLKTLPGGLDKLKRFQRLGCTMSRRMNSCWSQDVSVRRCAGFGRDSSTAPEVAVILNLAGPFVEQTNKARLTLPTSKLFSWA